MTLERIGDQRPLPGGFELSVYRIVQEALTNVLKHADPKRVEVTLAFRDSRLELEVVDDGSPLRRDAVVPGHGLVGMRERVALLGGELETGRRAGGGFRIAARLPVGGDAMSIDVLIVDDQELVRTGFRLFLETQPGLTVVGEAADGEEAIERARELRPDVVLMDIRMPNMDGVEATARLTSGAIEPPRACSSSRRSTSTSTSSVRCAPARRASCSRTRRASAWSRRSASSTPARRCCHRRSRAG